MEKAITNLKKLKIRFKCTNHFNDCSVVMPGIDISTHPMEKIDELLPSNWKKPEKKKAEITAEEIAT